jgi:hypothetical protein
MTIGGVWAFTGPTMKAAAIEAAATTIFLISIVPPRPIQSWRLFGSRADRTRPLQTRAVKHIDPSQKSDIMKK